MKYKIGDKVKVKSLYWYNQNKDEFGQVKCGGCIFPYPMTKHCGKIVTITCINTKGRYYIISEDDGYRSWTDEMFEGIANIESHEMNFEQVKSKIELIFPIRVSQYKVSKLDFGNIIKIHIIDYKHPINFRTLELLKNEFSCKELKIENDGYNRYIITFDVFNEKYFYNYE